MITKKQFLTTRDKLLELARFLVEEVKPGWFNLASWAEPGFPKKKCGTTACSVGWATVCFPKCGLKLYSDGNETLGLRYRVDDVVHLGFAAAAQFFGIDWNDAFWLFDPNSYRYPHNKRKNVAKRLKEIAKKYPGG